MFVSEKPPFKKIKSHLSRRDFLKFCSLSMAGLVLPSNLLARLDVTGLSDRENWLYGRVTRAGHPLYESPSTDSEMIGRLPFDSVYRVTGIELNPPRTSVIRTWYQLNNMGYAHSARIQPVRMRINQPQKRILRDGRLGEITIPIVDAYSRIDKPRRVVHRFYYGSTFWVLDSLVDEEGSHWYELLDDRFYVKYYIPAYSMRLVPDSELTPLAADVPFRDKKLVISLARQTLTAYIRDKVVLRTRISTGVRLREGGFASKPGRFRIFRKRPCRYMFAAPRDDYSGFDLPGVPWVSYYYKDGEAFHGTYWHNAFGWPMSAGCINMTPQAAKWLYRWTTPNAPPDEYNYAGRDGTLVVIE
jgi:hypothetical protein